MYSPQLLDHFENPRNVGEVVTPDAVAEVENPACGDVLRITLKTCAGQLTEVKFKAKGCVATIACASALTELVLGRTLDEARNSPREDVENAVGGLPQGSIHAAHLAVDTLSMALRNLNR
jgi:nitrogen fixation NifU-like protein